MWVHLGVHALVGMVITLASNASSYRSGQTYYVDGGCLGGRKTMAI